MIKLSSDSKSVIIILHEIYGINQHIKKVCKDYKNAGFDVICPNLLNRNQAFDYNAQEEAYQYFIKNVGFKLATGKVKDIILQASHQYKHIFILGFSIGATIAWLCSDSSGLENGGVIGYYGSRIRDYLYIEPKCKTLLIFSSIEKSFIVEDLIGILNKKEKVSVHMLQGKHGFSDPFSKNYCDKSYRVAKKLVENFFS